VAPKAGYTALNHLISLAHSGDQVGVTRAELALAMKAPKGASAPPLVVLLGPDSDVGRATLARDFRAARAALHRWKRALPARGLAVEVVTHLTRPGEERSTAHAVRMMRVARELGVPAVLTNAVRYQDEDGAATADVLDAVRALSSLAERRAQGNPGTDPGQVNAQGWLKPSSLMHALAEEIAREAGNRELAIKLLADTEELAQACCLDPLADLGWGQPVIPEAGVLGLVGPAQGHLRQRCEEGFERHFGSGAPDHGDHERARERLEHELGVIGDLNLAGYFLTVATATDLIRDLGVRSAARGSGASSLVAYLTGISHVNPIQHDLVFERFLSRERTSLPDIDVDVESARRHEVYRALFERFGQERTTLMSMQNAYRARGAVRDAGMALGMDPEEVDGIAKSVWRISASEVRNSLALMPELAPVAQRLEADRAKGGHQMDLLVDLTERLDRLPRHISMHPCGVILSDATLLDRTPVQPSGIELPMSQFDKHDMDPMGLIKLDVLGVRMQSTIAYTLDQISTMHASAEEVYEAGQHSRASLRDFYDQLGEEDVREYAGIVRTEGARDGAPKVPDAPVPGHAASGTEVPTTDLPAWLDADGRIDLSLVPLDDEVTYEAIRTTNTLGIFQIESPGQRELIGKLAPTEFNDLIIDISLFRPGPMQSDMVRPFLEQRHGFAPEDYPHPDLEPVLAETHGVVVFHEQVLRILDVMTGCGLAKADVMRRRLGNPEKEPDVEAFFRERAGQRGYGQEIIDRVWHTLAAFGSFGFCKAHGAAFAVPTYHSAWLKAHHPEAFLAGLFEHDPGMYPRRLLIAEARRLGIPLLPLDVNASRTHFVVEEVPEAHTVDPVPGVRASGRFGIRLAWQLVSGLSDAEAQRLESGAPYASVADVRDRARPTRTNLRRLAELGALDRFLVPGAGGRADLIHHLDAQSGLKSGRKQVMGQEALDLGVDLETSALVPVFPDPTPLQQIRTELDLTAADLSGHLMAAHHPYLERVGATPSDRLLSLHSGTRVLVAGVRVATQTPPMRSGERVVFISLDDGHGCVDLSFFTQAQHDSGPLLFSSKLLLVEGRTRRTGPRAVSVQALRAWDLLDPNTELPGPGYLDMVPMPDGAGRVARGGAHQTSGIRGIPGEAGGWYRGIVTHQATAADLAPAGATAQSRARPVPWRPGDGSDATGGATDGFGALGANRVKRAGGMG
jgi:error-prone DNA polymerase